MLRKRHPSNWKLEGLETSPTTQKESSLSLHLAAISASAAFGAEIDVTDVYKRQDQGLTGSFTTTQTGSNAIFTNNAIGLTFGSYVDPSIFGDYSIPLIASQPTNQTVTIASNVTFTVSAFGAGPLYYQWYFNNIAVSGATSAGYSLTNAMATNAGSYTRCV